MIMTNQDEEFQQRWEFRRGGDDEDSSTDDSKSSSHRADKKHNIVDYVLLHDDDEVSDSPRCHKGNNIDTSNRVIPLHSVEVVKKKEKSKKMTEEKKKKKKKNVMPMRLVAKGNQKRKRNLVSKGMVMLEDLKTFADSLIHELKVAREDMSAQMRKLAASRLRKKKVGCCKKNARNGSSVDRSMKSNLTSDVSNSSKAVVEYEQTQNELQKGEKSSVPKRAHMTLATDSDRVVSSPFLPSKPQLQGHENGIPFNDHILGGIRRENLDSEIEIGKLIQSGRFPHISSKNVGFLGQNCTQTAKGVGFLPNTLRQTYSENEFRDKSEGSRGGNSATLKFSGGNAEYVLGNSIRSNVDYRTEGEFVPLRLLEQKNDQVYMASLKNKQ